MQQILDCDVSAAGCDGGPFSSAYEWVIGKGSGVAGRGSVSPACVCVCVRVCERERDGGGGGRVNTYIQYTVHDSSTLCTLLLALCA